MELSAAMTEAEPSEPRVTVAAVRAAEAPEDGAAKVTVPPATGSSGLLAVTTTASGLAKAVPSVVCWGVLPATGRERETLALEGADIGWRVERLATLVGRDAADGRAGADGRAAGKQCDGLGRPAVIAQRGQAQVGEAGQDDIAAESAGDPARAAGADQVIRAGDLAGRGSADVGSRCLTRCCRPRSCR